jgi:hypothetical protein
LKILLVLLAFAATGALGAVGISQDDEPSAGGSGSGCAPQNTQQSRSALGFRSSFEGGDFEEWGGYNRRFQPEEYPPGAKVLDPREDGVPRREGCRVARFHVTLADARVRRTHAKLLWSWKSGSGEFTTRPPRNVSGVYSAWYYVPRNYRLRERGWVNIFQWKESYYEIEGDGREWLSDPTWWITLERGRRSGGIIAVLNNWDGEITAADPFPTGRWVQVKAELRQGSSIRVWIDGKRFGTASQRDYPVSPQYGRRALGWTFGVGNYSGRESDAREAVSGPLYVDDIRVRPLR